MDRLNDARLKLRRAQIHLAALNLATRRFLDREPHRLDAQVPSAPSNPSDKVYLPFINTPILRVVYEPPPELSLILGDYVHCLRSALDHLFWELMVYPRPKQAGGFPIWDDASPSSLGRLKQRLQLVPADVAKVIDDLQPYHRAPDFHSYSLWVIGALDNTDKHKRLNIAVLKEALVMQSKEGREVIMLRRTLNDGEHVFLSTIFGRNNPALNPDPDEETQIYVEPAYGVIPEESPTGIALSELGQLHDFVESDILPRFTRFFE